MTDSVARRLTEASETGEVLIVAYDGGLEPGTLRQIYVIAVSGDRARVREANEQGPRTYLIDRISLVTDTTGYDWKHRSEAPKAKKGRRRAQDLEPAKLFRYWAYAVEPHHWPIFGIALREYINPERTKIARNLAALSGTPPGDVSRIAIRDRLWTRLQQPIDVCEGDLFWARDRSSAIEVVAVRDTIEIHIVTRDPRRRFAYLLTEAQFTHCLEHGEVEEDLRIPPALSYSDTLRFLITQP